MSEPNGLICAYLLDGDGGGRPLDWAAITAWTEDQGVLWLHLDRTAFDVRRWLRERSGLDPIVVDALLAKGTRPRAMAVKDGLMVFLRGVNLNAGDDPVDMVSIRMFVEPRRIITVRRLHMMAIQDVREALDAGTGPKDSGEFLVTIAARLTERVDPKLTELFDELDQLEIEIDADSGRVSRKRLAAIRRDAITLHRYLGPQEAALTYLLDTRLDWLTEAHKMRLRETDDQIKRFVEDLDADREQASVMHDRIADRLSEQINRNMYLISVIAAIFLPLEFLTGLLGINVAGVPGQDNPWSFVLVVIGLAGIAGLILMTFRRMRWLDPIRRRGGPRP